MIAPFLSHTLSYINEMDPLLYGPCWRICPVRPWSCGGWRAIFSQRRKPDAWWPSCRKGSWEPYLGIGHTPTLVEPVVLAALECLLSGLS